MNDKEVTFVCVGELQIDLREPAKLYVRKEKLGAGLENTQEGDIEKIRAELQRRKVLSDAAKLIQGAVDRAHAEIETMTKGLK